MASKGARSEEVNSVSAGLAKVSILAVALLVVIGVLVACSAVLLGMPAGVSIVIAAIATVTVGWLGVRYFTPWGDFRGQLATAHKSDRIRGDASELIRLRLAHAQYAKVQQTLEDILPKESIARKALVDLVKQLDTTRLSINLVRGKAGVDLGQQQLLDSTNDFIIAKASQACDIHRHNYAGPVTENALSTIARQSETLKQQLQLCRTELVAASGRDSWDEDRLSKSQREIQSVAMVARNLNRDPFSGLDGLGESE